MNESYGLSSHGGQSVSESPCAQVHFLPGYNWCSHLSLPADSPITGEDDLLFMDSVLVLTSDLSHILGGMAATSKFHPLHGTLYALCPQVVGGPCGL